MHAINKEKRNHSIICISDNPDNMIKVVYFDTIDVERPYMILVGYFEYRRRRGTLDDKSSLFFIPSTSRDPI